LPKIAYGAAVPQGVRRPFATHRSAPAVHPRCIAASYRHRRLPTIVRKRDRFTVSRSNALLTGGTGQTAAGRTGRRRAAPRPRRRGGRLRALLVAGMTTVVVAGGGPAAHAAQQSPEPPPITDVGAVVDEVVPAQLAEDDIPGAIVTVVAGDRTVFTKGYGVADVGSDRPMDPSSTGFYTASEAKLFTATAALQL